MHQVKSEATVRLHPFDSKIDISESFEYLFHDKHVWNAKGLHQANSLYNTWRATNITELVSSAMRMKEQNDVT